MPIDPRTFVGLSATAICLTVGGFYLGYTDGHGTATATGKTWLEREMERSEARANELIDEREARLAEKRELIEALQAEVKRLRPVAQSSLDMINFAMSTGDKALFTLAGFETRVVDEPVQGLLEALFPDGGVTVEEVVEPTAAPRAAPPPAPTHRVTLSYSCEPWLMGGTEIAGTARNTGSADLGTLSINARVQDSGGTVKTSSGATEADPLRPGEKTEFRVWFSGIEAGDLAVCDITGVSNGWFGPEVEVRAERSW